MKLIKNCIVCEQEFEKRITTSKKDWSKTKFCSHSCHNLYRKGKPSPSPNTSFKKGHKLFSKVDKRRKRTGPQNNKWKGGDVEKTCQICQSTFFVKPYREETARFCSKECAKEFKQSEQERERLSKLHKQRVEEGLHNLYCGATEKNMLIRQSGAYKKWRTSVFQRDDYTCQICHQKGGKLNAHHLKPFSVYEDLRLELDNGQTLCEECHRQTDTWGKRLV